MRSIQNEFFIYSPTGTDGLETKMMFRRLRVPRRNVLDGRRRCSSHQETAVVGVLCCYSDEAAAGLTHQERHAVAHKYLEPLFRSRKMIPLLIPAIDHEHVDALMSRLDGVVLPGSPSNVHPERYGVDATPEHAPFDRHRDAVAMKIVRAAVESKRIPLLAICRGMQELNVAYGGTLTHAVHKIEGRIPHTVGDKRTDPKIRFAKAHGLIVRAGGQLDAILKPLSTSGGTEKDVNTCHFQAVQKLASPLRVEATAPDGTVEAVSVDHAESFALGVQWYVSLHVYAFVLRCTCPHRPLLSCSCAPGIPSSTARTIRSARSYSTRSNALVSKTSLGRNKALGFLAWGENI